MRGALLSLIILLAAGRAHAQACSSCSPLALPTSVSSSQSAQGRDWLLSGQLTAGWLSFPGQTAAGARFEDPNEARVDLGLLTVQAGASHRSGFGFDLLLPAAILNGSDVTGTRTDPGLGDLELRGRFLGRPAGPLALTGILGAAVPTGTYAPRSGALALSESASALTPGRGVLWGLLEGEARWTVHPRFTTAASAGLRLPLTDAHDGFRWTAELRGFVDGSFQLVPDRLSLGAGIEAQWRGVSSVIDPFTNARIASTNTGGVVLTAIPSVTVQLPRGFFASASVRLPFFQRLEGLQFNQGPGAFLGLGLAVPVGEDRIAASRSLGNGGWSVLKYEATWCQVCKDLSPLLADARARRPNVRFEAVDVTDWTQDELDRATPGASALPILEIRRPDGSVAVRLEGADSFSFERHLEEVLE